MEIEIDFMLFPLYFIADLVSSSVQVSLLMQDQSVCIVSVLKADPIQMFYPFSKLNNNVLKLALPLPKHFSPCKRIFFNGIPPDASGCPLMISEGYYFLLGVEDTDTFII